MRISSTMKASIAFMSGKFSTIEATADIKGIQVLGRIGGAEKKTEDLLTLIWLLMEERAKDTSVMKVATSELVNSQCAISNGGTLVSRDGSPYDCIIHDCRIIQVIGEQSGSSQSQLGPRSCEDSGSKLAFAFGG
jgi:hypothetical protein